MPGSKSLVVHVEHHYELHVPIQASNIALVLFLLIGFPASHPDGKVTMQRSWSWAELEEFVASLYPNLPIQLVGITYFQCKKGKQLRQLEVASVYQIQSSLGRGRLVVVPKRDLPELVSSNESFCYRFINNCVICVPIFCSVHVSFGLTTLFLIGVQGLIRFSI